MVRRISGLWVRRRDSTDLNTRNSLPLNVLHVPTTCSGPSALLCTASESVLPKLTNMERNVAKGSPVFEELKAMSETSSEVSDVV